MNYYNEFDPGAAAWLRELINRNLIPAGVVDTRSITEISPDELRNYTQCHFFAGIGGWSLALQLAGWPATRPVWTGSCPCQPFSSAGKQLGDKDERHLWPVFFNLIRECRPPVVFGEQVASAAVIGKRADEKAVREMLDRKAVLGVLLQWGRSAEDVLQGLRQFEKQDGQGAGLFIAPRNEARPDTGQRGEVSSEGDGSAVQSGSGGHPAPYPSGCVRADGHPVRSTDAEGLELPVTGPDNSGGRLHEGERARGDLCGQRDEPQLGAEPDFEDCGFHQGPAEEEIGRLIGAIGGGAEEAAPVWLDGIQSDLEEAGYTCGASVVAAAGVGSPHIRQRLYWVADRQGLGLEGGWGENDRGSLAGVRERGDGSRGGSALGGLPDASGDVGGSGQHEPERGPQGRASDRGTDAWSRYDLIPCADGKSRRIEPGLATLVAGIPRGVVPSGDPCREGYAQNTAEARVTRLRGYGNSIVPQLAAEFVTAFLEVNHAH